MRMTADRRMGKHNYHLLMFYDCEQLSSARGGGPFFERYCIFSIFSYFLHVTVSSSFLEKKISNHPGVEEALVRGVNVERIGMTLSVSFPRGQPPPLQKKMI